MNKRIVHWDDIFFTVVAEADEFLLQVKVYAITGIAENGKRTYESKNGYRQDSSLEEAGSCIEGLIKWDGCSDWSFGQMHFCRMQQGQNIGVAFERLYRLAAETIPNFDNE